MFGGLRKLLNLQLPDMLPLVFPNKPNNSSYTLTKKSDYIFDIPYTPIEISEVRSVQFVSNGQENASDISTDQLSATSPYEVTSDTIQMNVRSSTNQNDITSATSPYIPSTERTMQPVQNDNNEFLVQKEKTLLSPSFHIGGENEFDSVFNGGNYDEDRSDDFASQQRPSEIVRHFLRGGEGSSSEEESDSEENEEFNDDVNELVGGKRSDFTTSEVNRLNDRLMSSDTITLTDNIRNAMKNIKNIDSEYDNIKRTRTPKRSQLTESDRYTNAKFNTNPKYH